MICKREGKRARSFKARGTGNGSPASLIGEARRAEDLSSSLTALASGTAEARDPLEAMMRGLSAELAGQDCRK